MALKNVISAQGLALALSLGGLAAGIQGCASSTKASGGEPAVAAKGDEKSCSAAKGDEKSCSAAKGDEKSCSADKGEEKSCSADKGGDKSCGEGSCS